RPVDRRGSGPDARRPPDPWRATQHLRRGRRVSAVGRKRRAGAPAEGPLAMFGTNWSLSPREHEVVIDRHSSIPMADGITLDATIVRPDAPGEFPVIFGAHAYDSAMQSAYTMPQAMQGRN